MAVLVLALSPLGLSPLMSFDLLLVLGILFSIGIDMLIIAYVG